MALQKMQFIFMLQVEQFQRRILGIHPEKLSDVVLQKCLADKFAHLEEENCEVNKAVSLFIPQDVETYYDILDGYVDVVYILMAVQWLKKFTPITQFQENLIKSNYNLLNNIRRLLPPEIPYAYAFNLVHKANMAKVSGKKPGRTMSAGFDAIKPKGWIEPLWPVFFRKHLMKRKSRKTLILGDARSGKDTYAEFLRYWYGYKFVPAFNVYGPWIREQLIPLGLEYRTFQQCYEDRVNYRGVWFSLLCDYNDKDKSKLSRDILIVSDIYPGLRSMEELFASIHLFDRVIYIDALKRIQPEDDSSNEITLDVAHAIWSEKGNSDSVFSVVDNNTSIMKYVLNIYNEEKDYE